MLKKWILFSLSALTLNFTFAQNSLSPEILLNLKRLSEPALSPDGKFVLYVIETILMSANKSNHDIYMISTSGGNAIQLTSNSGNEFSPRWNSDGKAFTYLSDETGLVQLYETQLGSATSKQLTFFSEGVASIDMLPKTNQAIFTADVRTGNDVHDLYKDVPKSNAKIIDDLFYRTWNAWEDNYSTHLFVASKNADSVFFHSALDVLKGESFDVEGYTYSSDGKYIAYSSKKLNGKAFANSTNNDIYIYDVLGKTTTNISAGLPGYDLNPKFSKDGKKIGWTSMPTNGNEADVSYLKCYDIASKETQTYAKDLGENIEDFVWSEKDKNIYFLSEKAGTIQVFSVELSIGKITQLTNGQQDYASLSVLGNKAYALKSSFNLPNELVCIDLKSKLETQLTFTNKEILDNISFGNIENSWIRTTDSKALQTWIFFPPNFDASKKYPTILYCQGGPQVGISQSFSYRWNLQLMCAQGYIVVAPNRRGVPGFGKEWKDKISLDWGGQSIQDYLSAIDSISKRPYVDVSRIGAVGASYGGYSVYWFAGHNENHRFKTFIAHCGVFNLQSWYAMTDQTFFGNHELGGSFWTSPTLKSYLEFSPINYVKNWDTPIMVIHNEKDFRVPVSEGMQAFGIAQLKNIRSRFLYFPDEGHWVLKPQNSLVWHREFYRWLDETLKN